MHLLIMRNKLALYKKLLEGGDGAPGPTRGGGFKKRVCPSERFLGPPGPPPPINFVHDHLFFRKFIIIFLLFRVRLRHWGERCG